jgi:hypothetical protein
MRVDLEFCQGRKTKGAALALGELAKLDRTRSVRLVGFDVESLNKYLIFGDGGGNSSIFCSTCKESQTDDNLANFFSFAVEHDLRHP